MDLNSIMAAKTQQRSRYPTRWSETAKEHHVAVVDQILTPNENIEGDTGYKFEDEGIKVKTATTTYQKLEMLCQEAFNSGDIKIARRAIEFLIQASKKGCCFLENFIVMLLNLSHNNEELLHRIMYVDFDRQQLIENLRRPKFKLASVAHIINLLRQIQHMLDYRERKGVAIEWLLVIVDAYFVEIATSDEAISIINKISEHVDFQCALLREIENTKCLLNSIVEQFDNTDNSRGSSSKHQNSKSTLTTSRGTKRKQFPHYCIERIEF